MKKTLSFLVACFLCIGTADAVVRTANSNGRESGTLQSRDANARSTNDKSSARTATLQQRKTVARTSTDQRTTVSRASTTPRTTIQRSGTPTSRTAINNTARTTRATTLPATNQTSRTSRAAITSSTFGVGYNSCRDAYFTCMDQFCATADDTYRRCICSSRLDEIKKKQRALGNAADQIQDFHDLNIEVIPKTAAEVNAMLSASAGELTASVIKDTSDSAQKLAGISSVLTNTKSKSLSTAGTLDIAGDINAIWATTDLTYGINIANLTGETLYNAVHSQCANLVADHCESKSTLNMVIAAYGMYIENDCTLLSNALGKKKTSTNAAIRETEREMNTARLENYNAHNSTSINDCVANIRADITNDSACGTDYVHCLDVSGLYLNKATGEPIYTSNFYQLETMSSLYGDILTNKANQSLVAELNRKRIFAEKSLSTCQDLADEVWDEFVRQAITEIYQGQQSRIRQVKDECIDVVNKCYDKQTASLRDFNNTKEQLLLGSQLELSEQLCNEKLTACSNLYGGGPDGLQELISTVYNITSQKIAQNCLATLQDYVATICAVPTNDTLHSYPYACRVYAPGEQRYATIWTCQKTSQNKNNTTNNIGIIDEQTYSNSDVSYVAGYFCPVGVKTYSSCKSGYYLSDCGANTNGEIISAVASGNSCNKCPSDCTCAGGTQCPVAINQNNNTNDDTEDEDTAKCDDYIGSLYQQVVRYAIQACMRPSETSKATADGKTPISDSVLQDVNATMTSIRIAMSSELQNECERLGGYWVATQYQQPQNQDGVNKSASNIDIYERFYNETGANKKWGYCAKKESAETYFGTDTTTTDNESTSDTTTENTTGE